MCLFMLWQFWCGRAVVGVQRKMISARTEGLGFTLVCGGD